MKYSPTPTFSFTMVLIFILACTGGVLLMAANAVAQTEPKSPWLKIATSEGNTVYEINLKTLSYQTSVEHGLFVFVTGRASTSTGQVNFYKFAVNALDCKKKEGALMMAPIDQSASPARLAFVIEGGTVASEMAEALCFWDYAMRKRISEIKPAPLKPQYNAL